MAQAEAGGGVLSASAESLLSRIDKIDQRLRHLEEQRRTSATRSYWSGDMQWMAAAKHPSWESNNSSCSFRHQHSKSLSSALQEVHLKGTLLDRLHLLETRIHQLNFELDMGVNTAAAAGTSTANEYSQLSAIVKQQDTAGPVCSSRIVGGPWAATPSEIFQIGAREIQTHQPKTKAKDPKDDLGLSSAEKSAASDTCSRNEKRRVERARLYRRWFPVGC